MKDSKNSFLLEIGTEELPASVVDFIYQEFKAKAEKGLVQMRIPFESIVMEATPRRIALWVGGLSLRQEDQFLEFSGPSVEKAHDASGKPTAAFEGFVRSKNASLEDVVVKETPKGKFVCIQQHMKGKPTASVLPELVHLLLSSLVFSKTMRWDATGFRFPRPIRWVVAMLNTKNIPIKIGEVKSLGFSYGHRFLAPGPIKITSSDWESYRAKLRKAHVILERDERKRLICNELTGKYGQKHFDEELVDLNANLVEEPFLLRGNFNKDYLKLPAEVLACNMKKNQKIFACYDDQGKAVNHFIAVLNGKRSGLSKIQSDYENVLESRLRDGRYFYDLDTRESLESKLPLLDQIVYLGKLGSMRQKTDRMEKLAGELCSLTGHSSLADDLKRAARLSKIDLMTKLVYEFPELQGVVGGAYAEVAGEKASVVQAIASQYLPKSLTESFSDLKRDHSELDALLGIVDRLDFVVGAFGIGLEPTGSQDPYALRRAAGVIVKWVRAFELDFSIFAAVEASARLFGNVLEKKGQELRDRVAAFLKDRMVSELQLKSGTRPFEIFQAVWNAGGGESSIADIMKRYSVLLALYEKDKKVFVQAAKVAERTANILKGSKEQEVALNEGLYQEPIEKKLGSLCEEHTGVFREIIHKKDYEQATRYYAKVFFEPVNQFFDQVMVNVEDTAIRTNRQALVRRIHRVYGQTVADLSVLSRMDQE